MKPNRQTVPLSLNELPSILANWGQAATHFYSLYKALEATISTCRQKAYKPAKGSRPCSLMELEELQQEMLSELASLIANLKQVPEPATQPESTLAELKRLHSHTLHLQKLAKQIQRMLGLDLLRASQTGN